MRASARAAFRLSVNGGWHEVEAAPETPLLHVLRNDLGLNGPKYGCGLAQCGACMVLVEGVARRACVLPVAQMEGRRIVTLEGLGTPEAPDPVQAAFIAEEAAQCGYCTNGMIMSVKALLARTPRPSEQEIRAALRHNLCRCGTHVEILRAVARAVETTEVAPT
ncbi:(2Fe-2S)-binding protein [Lutibaculum baratangense]|uniref:Isoquinoline 1-oxidoreductase alpha subunit n=1 Tax=Lutibaculum baratangense AMV1 TaxID=631454 RepID=V4RA76_9HYPH|nr:(2Fe-2S)-binding protein [Lutibaculum baratangense]ESR23076.1 Isoquinoline 1-oxidoreductase alpha subunit [Lutibaculum baratangense AMV1]